MTENATVRDLDARYLEPPEPMMRTLAALGALKPGEKLRLLLHREPFPLYDTLRERNYTHRTTELPDGCFEILIWR